MKIGLMLPVGGSDGPTGGMPRWADVKALALTAESAGLDSLWIADHFFYRAPDGFVAGMHESWTLLSAVAALTERVELGNMVLCSTFRDPGLTAKMAAALDEVSGGRLILGVGAGWHDPEYEAFGLPTDHRFARFEEWLEIVARLVRGETVSFDGTYYKTVEANLNPMPERRIPILVAGARPRMLRLTAEWADAWNMAWYGAPGEKVSERLNGFRAVTDEVGKPVSVTVGVVVRDPEQAPGEADPTAFAGTVPELADMFAAYEALGVDHLIVATEPVTPRSAERIAEAKQLLASR
ncbi:LLM class flavin-dependent oxidoreductase [Kribbella sp. NPDC005582]|uniref:LLM class flavin-dependent oxidoreductase n=1 Tax=Kribbella sp. NPDC005582 TaxID=3156893 RepID=UPI0033B600DC